MILIPSETELAKVCLSVCLLGVSMSRRVVPYEVGIEDNALLVFATVECLGGVFIRLDYCEICCWLRSTLRSVWVWKFRRALWEWPAWIWLARRDCW